MDEAQNDRINIKRKLFQIGSPESLLSIRARWGNEIDHRGQCQSFVTFLLLKIKICGNKLSIMFDVVMAKEALD